MSFSRGVGLAALLLMAASLGTAAKKPALPEPYKRWLNEEVVYIISDDERKEFLRIADDAGRDKFMEEFWAVRNPVPGSKQNPFKEEHYKRLEYANQTFGRRSNTPGWMTDMGRTYILFGKPVSKATFTGYGQIYPLELWFYENKFSSPSLPAFFYALFFIPEDIGEYRFYHPIIDGPMQLVRGTRFQSNRDVYQFLKPLGGDIARAAFSLISNEPIDTQEYKPNISGEMLVSKIQNFANDSFNVKRIRELRAQRTSVSSYFLTSQPETPEVSTAVVTDGQGQQWLDYSVSINDEKLGVPDDAEGLVVSAGFRLTTENGELIVEDREDRTYHAYGTQAGKRVFAPFQIANRLPVVPGKYILQLQAVNRKAGKIFQSERKISVAAAGSAGMSEPLLVAEVRRTAGPEMLDPFAYYGIQFVPAVERRYVDRDPLRLLFQLQAPAGAADGYSIEYIIAHTQIRDQRKTFSDEVKAAEFQNGRLLKSKTLPLLGLSEGEYRAIVSFREKGSSVTIGSANVGFKIAEEPAERPLYFLQNFRLAARGGLAAYVRALEALAQKDESGALRFLGQAVDQNPANSYASQMLVQLCFKGGNYARVTALYDKLGIGAFRTAPEALAQVSLSYWQTGKSGEARRVLETARSLFPNDPLVASAAKSMEAAR